MGLFADLNSGVNTVRPGRTTMPSFDISMLIVAATLVMFGLFMVYSASISLADGPRYESYGRFYFVMRHGLFILVGLFCALCAVRSEEPTSELQSLMRISYAFFCF